MSVSRILAPTKIAKRPAHPGLPGLLALAVLVSACPTEPAPPPLRISSVYAEELGGPVRGLDTATLAAFGRGRAVMERQFAPSTGLGPRYNSVSCAGCHFFPVTGGAANRYRDQHLLQGTAEDGSRVDLGTDGGGPLRKLYSTSEGHESEPAGGIVVARRAPLSALGVGLFSLVSDEEIRSRADPADADADGISGRAAEVGGGVGRFGYKAQSATLEQAARAAWKEQLGVTSPALGWTPPAVIGEGTQAFRWPQLIESEGVFIRPAHAHPSNEREDPSLDEDAVADPELSAGELSDLLTFLTFLAPPPRSELPYSAESVARGEELFGVVGCSRCHVPELDSAIGPIPAYTDLLLHDMGDQLGPDVAQGDAAEHEFRTTPLLAVRLFIPYLHDSSVPAYQFLGIGHGGEAEASWLAYTELSEEDRGDIAAFLESLGGWNAKGRHLAGEGTVLPGVGEAGGPDRALSDWEQAIWVQGREKVDRAAAPNFNSGLGESFNADSCRACHFQPVLGGAGPNDVNVLLFDGDRGAELAIDWPLVPGMYPREVIERVDPWRMPDSAAVVEQRNSPSILGLGLLGRVPAASILARHDPDDADGDGISGRARIVPGGALGRFGWKAQVPTLLDFCAGALRGEMSMTTPGRYSAYSTEDDGDWWSDPELADNTMIEMAFYLEHIAPPLPRVPEDAAPFEEGRQAFADFGCASCHLPELEGLSAYTDLLLHDVAPADAPLVNREIGVLPSEFRTPPLWGVADTGPWLHDGSAESLEEAVLQGHAGEAAAARAAFEGASAESRAALIGFLGGI